MGANNNLDYYVEDDGTGVYTFDTSNNEISSSKDVVCGEDAYDWEEFIEDYSGNDTTKDETGISDIIGGDDRKVVNKTTIKPYSPIVYLEGKINEEITLRGTGVMISEDVVLTCAHNVNSSKYGKPKSIIAYPGRNNNSYPYGKISVAKAYTFSNYDKKFEMSKDLAILRLAEPIGYKCGYQTPINANIINKMKVRICGYPKRVKGQQKDSYQMWEHSGFIREINMDMIKYDVDTSGGQSGSPIYNSNNQIIGIHTKGRLNSQYNSGVRINAEKLKWINKYLNIAKNVYRLYNKNNLEHLFTQSSAEYYNLIAAGWAKEGLAWISPTSGVNVYRLYNPNSKTHYYTLKNSERNKLVKLGYRDEGFCWKSMSNGGVGVYKLYNPNAKSNQMQHHFTPKVKEKDKLVGLGWKNEGFSWYAYENAY